MKTSVIRKLNQLNHDFYQKIASDFDESRHFYWPGWYKLKPYLAQTKTNPKEFNVLDIGCGNGRFAEFLVDEIKPTSLMYTGVDTNLQLLEITKNKLDKLQIDHTVFALDIVETLLNLSMKSKFEPASFDLISILGVIHHIPSQDLRRQLLQTAISLLKEGGVLILASWQFVDYPRFVQKMVPIEKMTKQLGIDQTDLEPNDYFLTWERGEQAVRYCHYTSSEELHHLLKPLPDPHSIELLNEYRADGKENAANLYLILRAK